MKRIVFILSALAIGFSLKAQPPAGPASPGNTYGAEVNEKGAIAIAQLPAKLAKKDSISTKIVATVIDVCPKKGCWMNLRINDSTTAFVKMKDYAFFVPMDMVGKTIVLDGEAFIKTTSVKELQHYAEDAKKPQAEIDAITQPKKEIRFLAKGIKVIK